MHAGFYFENICFCKGLFVGHFEYYKLLYYLSKLMKSELGGKLNLLNIVDKKILFF